MIWNQKSPSHSKIYISTAKDYIENRNSTCRPGVQILWKRTVSAEFRANHSILCRNYAFLKNFSAIKFCEISVFHSKNSINQWHLFWHSILWSSLCFIVSSFGDPLGIKIFTLTYRVLTYHIIHLKINFRLLIVTQIIKQQNCDFITQTGLLIFFLSDILFSNITAKLIRATYLNHVH